MININKTQLNSNKIEENIIFISTYPLHKQKCMEMLGNSSQMRKNMVFDRIE